MTDLQVKYQVLRETQRSNLANEGLKARDLTSQERLRESQIQVNAVQQEHIAQQTENLRHEIALIDARTDLTKQQKATEKAKTLSAWTNAIVGIIDPFGGFSAFSQSVGKGLGNAVGSLGGQAVGTFLFG